LPALCQKAPLAFEAAEIKLNKSNEHPFSDDLLPSGQLRIVNASLRMLIAKAYRVQLDALANAPSWIDADRYDVVAKSKPGAVMDDIRAMLQALLAERFKLAVHREEKVAPAYVLTVGKGGPKLKSAEPSASPGGPLCAPADGPGPSEQFHMLCPHITIAQLASRLQEMAPRYITMPVINRTGIDGIYEIRLDWTPMANPQGGDDLPTIETAGGFTIFDAVAKLGLKLEKSKLPVPIIVIDHIERLPVEN
jgi:uncharacterized protein (TIGR03435 family)